MIEELTPQLLFYSLLMAAVLASLLTLLVAAVVRLAYRRGVLRAMAERAAPGPMAWPLPAAGGGSARARAEVETAIAATRRTARSIAAAGAAFVLVFAVAALLAFPTVRSAGRFLVVMWVCSWPIVPALLTTVPLRRSTRLLLGTSPILLWALAMLLTEVAAALAPPSLHSVRAYFYTITPPAALFVWLLANAPPTLMWWLFANRRLRAVGPLLLGFATALAAGGLTLVLWLSLTRAGTQWLTGIVDTSGLSQYTVLAMLLLSLLLASAVAGWAFMYRARLACQRKQANDQSLLLDALWLLFAVWYAMILVLAGAWWLLTAPLAYAAYRLAMRAVQRWRQSTSGPAASLVFLRVFSLGRRSDQLFDRLTRYWRHLASVDLICGPDIAHSTVQPHQLMDFLTGRMAAHFIADPASLARRLAERDLAPDHDGRYRVNAFYCHADTWTHVLPALVSGAVVVLMDLRSLSRQHDGCARELHHLVAAVPLTQVVLVVDASTNQDFLRATLAAAWRAMPADSPNCAATPEDLTTHALVAGDASLRQLLARLCAAAPG